MVYTKEQIQHELDALKWFSPENFRNNKKNKDGEYFLFRGHDRFEDNINQNLGLVHLTPFFDVAASIFRFKLSLRYVNFPPKYFFISVYSGGQTNKFYPDETLEEVFLGNEPDNGILINEIDIFNKEKHFETKLSSDNHKICTYIVKFENALKKTTIQIAEISDVLKQMLDANKKLEQHDISLMIEKSKQILK